MEIETVVPDDDGDDDGDDAALTDALTPFLPLAQQFLDNQSKALDLQHRSHETKMTLEQNRVDLQTRHLDAQSARAGQSEAADTVRFKLSLAFVSAVTFGFFALAFGLIFLVNNVAAGLSVLTHVGAVATGVAAGMGIQKVREASAPASRPPR